MTRSWLTIIAFLIATGALFGLGGGDTASAPNTTPPNSQSARAAELSDNDALPAIVVLRGDINQLRNVPAEMAQAVDGVEVASPLIPDGPNTAHATLNIDSNTSGLALTDTVEKLRNSTDADVLITGPAGYAADTAAAFKGANFTLLAVTALVVALLLIITYRSPILWLIPLTVTALADRAAALITGWLSTTTGWFDSDGSTAGITSVLVFGAGTNYALLLVSRYREELAKNPDHALHRAWKASLPAIISSNLTVVLALQTLLLASVPSLRSLGISSSIGLIIALIYSLLLLPAALHVCGTRIFWPKYPTPNSGDNTFGRIARRVDQHPTRVLITLTLILITLGCGIFGTRIGLSAQEQFRTRSEAVEAAALLPSTSPVEIYNGDPTGIPGVTVLGPAENNRIIATIDGDNPDTVREIRKQLPNAIVGGQLARDIDTKDGTLRDLKVVVPLIFLAVLIVLIVVLRALVAPILLLGAAALSTWAALGAGTFVSTHIFGFPGLDTAAPVYSILFLIALGIDYTVFLVLRAKEEHSMVAAVGLTGSVITSAGIVLAAVFAVLGVLPLITLTQVGIIVGFGILLDTFLVRTLVVPALFSVVGEKMWWPNLTRS